MSEKLRIFRVTIPIRGHIEKVIEAGDADAAIEQALADYTIADIEEWEAVESQATADDDTADDTEAPHD